MATFLSATRLCGSDPPVPRSLKSGFNVHWRAPDRGQVKTAWQKASTAGAVGPFLNPALAKAVQVSEQVRSETAIGRLPVSIPTAALELARQIFGTLDNRRVLLLGTDEICELSVRHIMAHGDTPFPEPPGTYKFMVAGAHTPNVGITQPCFYSTPQVFAVNVTMQSFRNFRRPPRQKHLPQQPKPVRTFSACIAGRRGLCRAGGQPGSDCCSPGAWRAPP